MSDLERLQRFALENQKSGKSRPYVATQDEKVTAYYSLAPGSSAPAEAPPRVTRGRGDTGCPRHPAGAAGAGPQ